MERGTLQPLPDMRFELRSSSVATVMKNGHVCLGADKHYYSVPYGYISKKVRVLYSKSVVEIFYKYESIAQHQRVRSAHNYTTDPSHMATQHLVLAEWNPDYFMEQARGIGKDVEYYIAQVLNKKPHPEQAYKSCQGILSFGKRVGHMNDQTMEKMKTMKLHGMVRAFCTSLESGPVNFRWSLCREMKWSLCAEFPHDELTLNLTLFVKFEHKKKR